MAENGRKIIEESKSTVDKEARFRTVKDRQNEERHRKLEEIKAQALAAQIFKDQKEQERRRRFDELRIRDDTKRQQVEERKRAINEAEKDRLEFILRKNQQREQRLETKKRHERSNAVFAFGSSTPRMLDPNYVSSSFWGTRRATSIQNIVSSTNTSTLTRRQSERDLDVGSKKRATSATGLERTGEKSKGTRSRNLDRYNGMTRSVGSAPVIPAGCASGYSGRRRTDLVPTIPLKESISSSRKSLNHSPGRAYSMTRLDQLAKPRRRHDLPSLAETNSFRPLSSSSHSSVTRSMSHLAVSKTAPSPTRRELNKADSRSMQQLTEKPLGLPRTTRATQLREQKMLTSSNCSEASSRPSSSLSQQSTNSLASSVSIRQRLTTVPRKPRPVSIAVTGISTDAKNDNKPPLPKARRTITKTTTNTITSDKINRNKAKTPVDSVTKTFKNTTVGTVAVKEDKLHEELTTNQKSEENHVPPNITKPESVNGEVEFNVPQNNKSDIEVTSKNILKSNNATEGILINIELENDTIKTQNTEKIELNKVEINYKTAANTKETTELDKNEIAVSEHKAETLFIDVQVPEKEGIAEPIKPNSSEVKAIELEKSKVEDTPVEKELPKPVKDQKSLEDEKNKLNTSTSQSISDHSLIESQVNMDGQENEMTTSMTKVRINTEEEAKAALAERRRLIREETERQAEMERLRLEAEAKAEFERQQREEEQIRQLIELQRQSEQERLQEAIRETQKREEEEKLKKEEEQKLKLLKEEAEKKAKEDAEKQKAELQERLKNEEKEREARRKRVEAIMLRTRGKNANNTQSTDEKNENKSTEEMKSNEESKVNGTKIEEQENGTTKISKDIVDNLIPSEIVKNANTVTIESMNTNDSINSNNTWRDNQQYGNFVCNNNS